MKPEEALNLIDQIIASIALNRVQHAQAQQAIMVLADEVKKGGERQELV